MAALHVQCREKKYLHMLLFIYLSYLSKYISWGLIIFITQNIWTNVFIFVVIVTTFGRYILRPSGVSCLTSNWTLYLIHKIYYSNSVNHDRVQALRKSKYYCYFSRSYDWTCNLQMVTLRSTFQPNALSTTPWLKSVSL